MDFTQMVGNTNELKCLLAFIQLGYECSIPYGNGAKYDFIVDTGNKLYRIQCKSSHYVNDHGVTRTDSFCFSTSCQTVNTKEVTRHKYDSNQIDFFATCFNDQVYLVPVDECSTSKTLRLEPPKNGSLNYSDANDYILSAWFSESPVLEESRENYLNRLNK